MLVIKTMAATPPADRKALRLDPFASFTGPSLRLEDPEGLGTATLLLPGGGSGAAGLALSRSLDEDDLFSLAGEQAANMTSVTLGLTQDLGATGFLALSGEIGVTDLGGATDITHATTARFDAVQLMAGQGDLLAPGDWLQIGVALPIAVASGQTSARLPVLRQGAAMSHEDVTLDLAPNDRQLDFEPGYMALFGQGLYVKLSLVHSENYGNRAGARDTGGAIALGFRS